MFEVGNQKKAGNLQLAKFSIGWKDKMPIVQVQLKAQLITLHSSTSSNRLKMKSISHLASLTP